MYGMRARRARRTRHTLEFKCGKVRGKVCVYASAMAVGFFQYILLAGSFWFDAVWKRSENVGCKPTNVYAEDWYQSMMRSAAIQLAALIVSLWVLAIAVGADGGGVGFLGGSGSDTSSYYSNDASYESSMMSTVTKNAVGAAGLCSAMSLILTLPALLLSHFVSRYEIVDGSHRQYEYLCAAEIWARRFFEAHRARHEYQQFMTEMALICSACAAAFMTTGGITPTGWAALAGAIFARRWAFTKKPGPRLAVALVVSRALFWECFAAAFYPTVPRLKGEIIARGLSVVLALEAHATAFSRDDASVEDMLSHVELMRKGLDAPPSDHRGHEDEDEDEKGFIGKEFLNAEDRSNDIRSVVDSRTENIIKRVDDFVKDEKHEDDDNNNKENDKFCHNTKHKEDKRPIALRTRNKTQKKNKLNKAFE